MEDADHLMGRIVPVRIERGQQNSLTAALVDAPEDALKQRAPAARAPGPQA